MCELSSNFASLVMTRSLSTFKRLVLGFNLLLLFYRYSFGIRSPLWTSS